jgi:hypothetical protein
MQRYEVTFERSAVQVRRVLIDAENEEAAVEAAAAYVTKGEGAVVHLDDEIYPDEESDWEHFDTEQRSK